MIECNVLDGEYPKKSHGEILMLHVYTINDYNNNNNNNKWVYSRKWTKFIIIPQ